MIESRFAYFLNAVLYNIWFWDIRSQDIINRMVYTVMSLIPKYLLWGKCRDKVFELQRQGKMEFEKIRYDKESGFHIVIANNLFGAFYSCYSGFLSFVIAGILIRKFVAVINPAIMIVISIIPIGAFYIPAYKAVFTDDRYLKYFKQFEKEDKRWHKKWALITWAFCVGGVLINFFGIITMMAIVSGGYSNINVPFLPH